MTLVNENNNEELLKIGKPCAYHESIDPNHRIGKFLRSRMNVIDLIPCSYKLDFSKRVQESTNSSGLVPQITYDEMENYANTCLSYGLGKSKALRLYTTDDTSVSDSIQNTLKDNYFQSGLNTISETVSPLQEFMRSIDKDILSDTVDKTGDFIKSISNIKDGVGEKLLDTATDVIAKGHRISLPSIWSNSQYEPHFTATIKLASPYGHTKAVKEFIIRPLMHLLILASPKTADGVSYGHPYNLTIKAYGLNYSPIGVISNITLRRGGNDSSFNIFRQPLSIDVSLDFQYLVKGFAHYDYDTNISEAKIFENADQFEYLTDSADTALPTLGHILTSLKPKEPENDIKDDIANFYSSMTAARNTKESASDITHHISKNTPVNPDPIVSKTIDGAAKVSSDNITANEEINALNDSLQDNTNNGIDDFTNQI